MYKTKKKCIHFYKQIHLMYCIIKKKINKITGHTPLYRKKHYNSFSDNILNFNLIMFLHLF